GVFGEGVPLFDQAAGFDAAVGAQTAAVANDRAGLDDRVAADVAAVDHRAGPDYYVSSITSSLSGRRCRTVFSRIFTRAPMRTGPCESPMILTPAPMMLSAPTTTSPVISAVSNRIALAATWGCLSLYA